MATTYTIKFSINPSGAGTWDNSTDITGIPGHHAGVPDVYQKAVGSVFYLQVSGVYTHVRVATANAGYTFKSLTGFTNNVVVSQNITVTANFTKDAEKWTTHYYANDDTASSYHEESISPYTIKACKWTRDNYTFNGWNTSKDGSGTSYAVGSLVTSKPSGGQLTLYAQWKPKNMIINIVKTVGGTADPVGSKAYAYGSKQTITAIPNEHYKLNYWKVTFPDGSTKDYPPEYDGDMQFNYTVYGNRTITVYFKKMSYTLSVYASPSKGGAVSGGGYFEYNTSHTIKASPNLGYKFSSWSDGGTGVSKIVRVTDNISYTATFEPKTYKVKLNTNGGKWLENEQPDSTFITGDTTKTFDTGVQLVSNIPFRFGYSFSGWGWRKDATSEFKYVYQKGGIFDDNPYKEINGAATEITLYAKWTPINNTIKFHYFIGDTAAYEELWDTKTYTIETPNPYKYYSPSFERGANSAFLGWSKTKPSNWGEVSQKGHGNYPIPTEIPVEYSLPFEVDISNIRDKNHDNKEWGTTIDVYGFWTVTGKYIKVTNTGDASKDWKKISVAYVRTDKGWKVVTDMYAKTGKADSTWKHEVQI